MFPIPSTIVRKMTGAMTIFTRLMKMSPSGFIARAVEGAIRPRMMARLMATRTWTVRLRCGRIMGGVRVERGRMGARRMPRTTRQVPWAVCPVQQNRLHQQSSSRSRSAPSRRLARSAASARWSRSVRPYNAGTRSTPLDAVRSTRYHDVLSLSPLRFSETEYHGCDSNSRCR
jgi:hypothetical protein